MRSKTNMCCFLFKCDENIYGESYPLCIKFLIYYCLDLHNVYNILHFCLFIHLFNFAVLGFKSSTLQMQVISDSTASKKCFLNTCVAYLSGYCDFYLLEHLRLYIPEAFWLVNYTIFTMAMSEPSLPWFFSKLKYHLNFPAILCCVTFLFIPILL